MTIKPRKIIIRKKILSLAAYIKKKRKKERKKERNGVYLFLD